ncbi:hypothetical protein LJ207_07965 [Halanaerobium sp. Z-7514]|uniref:Uncharacterized protein n=1 Tax=Halanaerobium polyolivorans TaxID=2886943 RepID=A0AAW4X0D3_9FIRM|nr:hypothetical protein [Halanaerobium polyolivorans]MCC3145258.1 hypothetical protein [Halanaerobium polyolivorans]RQD70242.1 MAG: hypothetical protein D5S01_10420 [Halanaerobium sp. MSAO_Bac5]
MKKLVSIIALALILISFSFVTAAESSDPWQRAKERGVEFRAVGNEPGWHVEITEDKRINFVNDYGSFELKLPIDDVWYGPEGEDKIYYVENHLIQFQVIVMKKAYQDTMSGEEFPYQVRVLFPNASYLGGGRLLIDD